MKTANDRYNEIFDAELERRLKRPATVAERTNADNDSDLVNEVLWQMIDELYTAVSLIKDKLGL